MRIVAISDQHGTLPDIPPCDLLIVAGDQCPDYPSGARERIGSGPQTQRQLDWFETVWCAWRERQPAKMCVLTHGNHDYCGELMHKVDGPRLSYSHGETLAIVDDVFVFNGLRIWLTPWSSQFRDWAFMKPEDQLVDVYSTIPADIDILVSHQPPAGCCDMSFLNMANGQVEHLGSNALRDAVDRVQPQLLVCGHIHGGHGQGSMFHDRETRVYNVAILNEKYEHVHAPTVIDL